MDSYIDREFDTPPDQTVATGISLDRRFTRMVAASVLLHLVLSTPFFITGRWSRPSAYAPLVDLSLEQPSPGPASVTPPLQKPAEIPAVLPPEQPAVESSSSTAKDQPPPATPVADPFQQTSFGLGISRGFFRSIADGQSLKPDIKDYYFAMLEKINASWWANGGSTRDGVVQEPLIDVLVGRNGEIIRKMLVRSSGNPAYDRDILRAVDAAAPLPALPESFGGDVFEAPVKLVAPRGLMVGSGLF